eukprot:CAMPEP_0168471636 /NCGR_PEP_ID=MMETSP0228-20121227/59385_1 /TAXON_ID=133427 /ORGANISM="Protoceratium reticulatum, Strain CCCM 535 (=CCMP 1889)" /LENGTH=380 /DNA_ID=CAMNT_0008487553 /DNA_START=192 /DNA_END=1334 /DNA_ORIENTATION=-
MITWNVENVMEGGGTGHVSHIGQALRQLAGGDPRPDVMLLQEVDACKLLMEDYFSDLDWDCIEPAVSETKMKWKKQHAPGIALGNLILYRSEMLSASKENRSEENRVLDEGQGYAEAMMIRDTGSQKTLLEHHKEACTWGNCKSPTHDMPDATSVKLYLRKDKWTEDMLKFFSGGIRFVNVHLYAGFAGHRQQLLSPEQLAVRSTNAQARRAFQMRSVLALNYYWKIQDQSMDATPMSVLALNHYWKIQDQSKNATPTTIYAGDFNTKAEDEMKKLVASASDYGVLLYCPGDGKCEDEVSTLKTNFRGDSFLDHVTVEYSEDRREAIDQLLWQGRVLKQDTRKAGWSDHNPLLVQAIGNAAPIVLPNKDWSNIYAKAAKT